jgi:hypothetical protein
MGLMEHASIAAFARFTLQLLCLSAPADLVEQAHMALADETKHARMCFAIASAYAGSDIGPGALQVDRSLDILSLADVLVTTIREGCIGETIAALQAAEVREHSTDPAIRDALETIARDETRHAELAWRFVQWALSQGGDEIYRATQAEFEKARDLCVTVAPFPFDEHESRLLAGGILPDRLRDLIQSEGMSRVVLPCAHGLLRNARGTGQSMISEKPTLKQDLLA